MATLKGEVKGGRGEQFELLLVIIYDFVRVHPTWSGFKYVHYLLCATYFGAMVVDVKVFTI